MSKARIKAEAEEAERLLMQGAEEAERAQAAAEAAHEPAYVTPDPSEPAVAHAAGHETPPAPVSTLPQDDQWEQRYRSLQGMFAKLNEANAELRGRVEELSRSAQKNTPETPEPTKKRLISDDELKDYGTEFIDVTQRAAREVFEDKIEALQNTVARLTEKLQQAETQTQTVSAHVAHTVDDRYYNALDAAYPDWETLNNDQGFLAWLEKTDEFTGLQRKLLIRKAFDDRDAKRTLAFFKAYRAPSAPTPTVDPASLVAPSRAAAAPPAAGGQKKVWSQKDVEAVYNDYNRGRISKEQFDRKEKEIMEALSEGRVR